jgi:hypothetical protein
MTATVGTLGLSMDLALQCHARMDAQDWADLVARAHDLTRELSPLDDVARVAMALTRMWAFLDALPAEPSGGR